MKKVFLVILLLLFPVVVNAEECDSTKIKIDSITFDEGSNSVSEINDADAEGKNINLNLSMSEVGDNIKYKIILKNESSEDYEIDKNDFKISSEYIDYSFESEDNSNIIKANSSKTIYLKVEYKNEVPDDLLESGSYNDSRTMKVNLFSEDVGNILTNPNTGAVFYFIIIIGILLLTGIMFFVLRKRSLSGSLMILILTLIIIPISVKAICKYDIVINSEVKIVKYDMCVKFNNDYEWKDIVKAIKQGHTDCMSVGDTKDITLTEYGTHKVRISNKSTPDVCSDDNFSQTACGFVVEFEDIIFKRGFNSTTSNAGGWKDSEIRPILNNDVYNQLPEDLRNGIIDTKAISGHERNVADNYTTVDKLYLLSTSEVWLKCGTNDIGYDAADQLTRQLDYYESIGVTSENYDGADKKYNGSSFPWWLRTAHKTSDNYVGNVYYGQTNAYRGHASLVYGISPAFRI